MRVTLATAGRQPGRDASTLGVAPSRSTGEDARRLGVRLLALIERFPRCRVAVVGDLIADEFIYGRLDRVSREAPVLILRYDATEIVPGGAGNAANNVAALGGRAIAIGLAGRDEAGRRMLAALRRRAGVVQVVRPAGYRTPTKTRILAGGIHSAKQQVVRIDRGAGQTIDRRLRAEVERRLLAIVARCDALLVSDYGGGLVTPALVARAARRLRARGRSKPLLIDSRYDLLRYRGLMTACTPNQPEVEHLLGVRINDDLATLERAGRRLLARSRAQAVLVTRGSRGMALFEPRRPTRHVAIYGSDEIADVTGAGDTVIATLTLALAAGASPYEAARLANCAGGLVVMKRGTATVSPGELRHAVSQETGLL
jgi:rfaE bifunctional protein kinase chain/domain